MECEHSKETTAKLYPLVPEHILDALYAYVESRRPTGNFLRAVLSNDLEGAVNRADLENLAVLKEIVGVVYNVLPSPCWGSEETVKNWLAKQTDKGEQDADD